MKMFEFAISPKAGQIKVTKTQNNSKEYFIYNMSSTVSEVGLELSSSLKSGFLWARHLQSTV